MENTNTITTNTFASNLCNLLSRPFQVFRTCLPIVPREITPPLVPREITPPLFPDYDVFINHRGPDTKDIFATDLYRCLVACGFQVFLDEPEMQVGDSINSQLKHAIETAAIQIAIFSPTYAQSRWCLEELQHMWMERESRQASIVPVFYEVEPSVVRGARKGQTGAYAKALSEHEKRLENFETIENWRKALLDVANISGLELKKCNGCKDELLANVVKHLLNIREKSRLKYVLKEIFERTMRSDEPKFIGIVGAAGIGMTKLAKEFKENNKSSRCLILAMDVKPRTCLWM